MPPGTAMEPGSSPGPAAAGFPVIVADARWRRLVARPEQLCLRAAMLAGAVSGVTAGILLTGDFEVKRLNHRFRGRNKPTNVLTFDPGMPGMPGEIVLALGVVRREAATAGRRPAHHLAHLVVHGMLHLGGHDHHRAGEARRMEMAETRLLHRLGVPNPWKRNG